MSLVTFLHMLNAKGAGIVSLATGAEIHSFQYLCHLFAAKTVYHLLWLQQKGLWVFQSLLTDFLGVK